MCFRGERERGSGKSSATQSRTCTAQEVGTTQSS